MSVSIFSCAMLIVGSAIVKIIAEHGTDCVPYVKEYVARMKKAVAKA